ncbi:MAG: hypothetical protein M1272_05545 [Firmicutes bacterium]|nr:hypothetical protein [Bacillota bacterium]
MLRHAWRNLESRRIDEAYELADEAAETARNLGHRNLLSQARLIRGWSLMERGEVSRGLDDIAQAVGRFMAPPGIERPRALQSLAMAAFYNDHYVMAESYLRVLIEVTGPRSPERGAALVHLAIVQQTRYGPAAGFEEFRAAEEMGQEIGERRIEAWGLEGRLAIMAHRHETLPTPDLKRLGALVADNERAINEISLGWLTAYQLRHDGAYQQAIDILQAQRSVRVDTGTRDMIPYELARNHLALRDFTLAQQAIDEGLALPFGRVRSGFLTYRFQLAKAWLHHLQGRTDAALQQLSTLQPVVHVMGLPFHAQMLQTLTEQWTV